MTGLERCDPPLPDRRAREGASGRVGLLPPVQVPVGSSEPSWPTPAEGYLAELASVSARGEMVGVQVYGHPWVMGEYWPMITPCFQVSAVDDAGNEYDGMPGGWHGFPGNEGHGSFFFWPPVDPARKSIRVTVSTLWEAAWADIELPR